MAKKKISVKRRAHSGTPVLRRKLRPRGKSFERGNRHGLATRFVKGVSNNPGGRPSFKAISEALRWMLSRPLSEVIVPQTRAEGIALGAIREASKRKLGFIAEVADRVEGRPRVSVDLNENADPLTAILAEVRGVAERLGPPEGAVSREEEESQQ